MLKIMIAVVVALATAYAGISASSARGDKSMGGGMKGKADMMGNMMGGGAE